MEKLQKSVRVDQEKIKDLKERLCKERHRNYYFRRDNDETR